MWVYTGKQLLPLYYLGLIHKINGKTNAKSVCDVIVLLTNFSIVRHLARNAFQKSHNFFKYNKTVLN